MIKGAVILAGGIGRRMGSTLPKQFIEIGGRPILSYSIDHFAAVCGILAVVAHPDWLDQAAALIPANVRAVVVKGGDTRQLSVYNGLLALHKAGCTLAAIHDGVRPFAMPDLISRTLDSALDKGSGIAASVSRNTAAVLTSSGLLDFPPRDRVYLIQTPQSFRLTGILAAHEKALAAGKDDYTDDSQVYRAAGYEPRLVTGPETNMKITSPEDLIIAEAFLSGGMIRTGG